MKILCVHQGAELYGSDRSFALSVETLRDKYPEATLVVIIPNEGELIPYLEPFVNEIIIQDVGAIQRSDFKLPFSTLIRLCKSSYLAWKRIKHFDVVYMNTIVVFAFMIASIFSTKTIIHHIREIPSKTESYIFSLLFRLNKSFLIFNSQYTKNSFSFLKQGSNNVVLNGVQAFESEEKIKNQSTFNILLIGRINAWKGQTLAIKAIELLASKYPQIRLRIVGSAAEGQEFYVENMLTCIKQLELSKYIEYVSFQNDPKEHFYWSTISVVPSTKPEPFGRVAIESLALGRPVIASNHGGLIEIIKADIGGYLFNAGDENDLAIKISLLIDDEELLRKKSVEAKDCFEKNFSEKVYKKNFNFTFNQILKNNNL